MGSGEAEAAEGVGGDHGDQGQDRHWVCIDWHGCEIITVMFVQTLLICLKHDWHVSKTITDMFFQE